MSADGDLSYKITGSTSSADDWALEFYDHNAKDGSPFLRVDFADAQTIFGDWTSGELSSPEIQGFTEAFLQNCFIMDTDNVKFGTHKLSLKDLDLASSIKDDLGDGGFLFGGAWSGNFLSGNIDGDYYMGTNHDDVLFGFDITGSTLEPKTGGGLKFFGFGGDNLFGTGDGKNVVYGGDGNNTVTYQYGDMAIYADMTDKATHPTNSKGYGDYYEIHQGTSDSIVDYDTLYNVQNIVGSRFDDVLTGDQKDNTFYSTGGANTWTGTGGANTFFLNGGSAEITDYTESDTIKVDNSVYQTKGANMSWIEAEGSWALYDSKSDSNIVTLDKTDGFEAPSEFTMIWKDGTEHIKTVDVQYMELLAA
jgi:Ca2+-binding RTX toxin-like protein